MPITLQKVAFRVYAGYATPPANDADFTYVVDTCGQQTDYRPGVVAADYLNTTECWLGAASLTYTWPQLKAADAALVRAAYTANKTPTSLSGNGSRYWLMLYHAETAAWLLSSGLMDEPQGVPAAGGEFEQDFKLTFSSVGFHLEDEADATDPLTAVGDVTYGGSSYANNLWYL